MSREFSIVGSNQTVLGATTCIFLNPPAAPNVGIRLLRAWIGQNANATSAQTRIQLVRQVTAFPTLVAATPRPLKNADATASVLVGNTTGAAGTAGINASAEGAGAKTVVWDEVFNNLQGWQFLPALQGVSNEGFELPAGSLSGLGLFFPAAPVPLTNWTFGMTFAEF